MIMHIKGLMRTTASAALLLAASVGMAHAAYYAKTISSTTIYSLEANDAGGPVSYSTFWQGGTNLAGIATYGDYAFVSDNTLNGPVLRVFHMGGGLLATINLRIDNDSYGVQSAGAVTVDGAGRVYVADAATNSSSRFAVITASDWAHPTSGVSTNYGDAAGHWQMDIAGRGDGAVLIQRAGDLGGVTVAQLTNDMATTPISLLGNDSTPVAVAVDQSNNNAYVVSNTTTLDESYNYQKTINVMSRSSDLSALGSLQINSSTAHDLAFATDGASDFLAMAGISNGSLQAWKISLTGGVPVLNPTRKSIDIHDQSGTHKVATSKDGKMLWITAQATGMAYGVDFGNLESLTQISSLGLQDQIFDIASHDYVAAVPEPSSLLSLAAFGLGALGFIRRRK